MKEQHKQAKSTLLSRGYSYSDNQHNGVLYAKMVGTTLFRAVIQHGGDIKYYLPVKANKYQKRIFS